ncbi:WD repeat-containing protein on Y chromosome-like isoform X2 [Anneissia japonica]|uniref:WD repeat-containing protein on Y chromosome-like isoform X2 n=1 Tax=Anneissia japonica TaxID=1529436 RepID=UPI0014259A6D|nr:WD repeat-containing protein on Y chromosome-like isoform X2 [Anneissia japonica]
MEQSSSSVSSDGSDSNNRRRTGSKESSTTRGKSAEQGRKSARLEDEMNNEHLRKLQQIFEEADEDQGGGLDIDEFRQAMRKIMGEGMVDDHELAIVFMKVDANCDGTVDWDEYLSYMLFEYQERDLMSNLFKDIPFPRPLREIASNHRDTITKVAFYQTISHRHGAIKEEEHGGRYISVSKEGVVNFWTTEMHHIRSATIEQPREKTKPMWLTDLVCMSNINMISISSTERDISFYDVNASKFDKCFQVSGLEYPALAMDYWFDKADMNNAILTFGDSGGGVSAIIFTEALGSALFGQQNAKSVGSRRVPFPELLRGTVKGVKAVRFSPLHDDWVRKVKYCDNLHSFVSCATTNDTSLYIGDLEGKKSGSFFKLRKGVLCFDYCKDNNIIVTGGMDRAVRIWNPYVTTKATGMMKGHTSAVINVVVNGPHFQIISVGKDKGIKVWDMRDQTCVQNINPRIMNLGPHLINTVCFHAKTGSLILGTNQLAILEHKWEVEGEEDEVTSHNKPVTEAIYNSLFNQVVSSCHDSVVSVWDIMTGLKTIQFANAHKYIEKGVEKCAEITAMTFDPTGRRLVTGGRNGTVKIWNFNNGACLRELEVFDSFEVTGIVVPRQRIVTAGWNRRITTYIDYDDDDDSRQWEVKHKEDILSLAYYDPSILATSSYDGDIYIWSLETAHALCKLNANESANAQSVGHTATSALMDRQESKQSFAKNEGSITKLDKQLSNMTLSQYKEGYGCNKSDDDDDGQSLRLKSTQESATADDLDSLTTARQYSASSLPAINTKSRNSVIDQTYSTADSTSRPDSRAFVTDDVDDSNSDGSLEEEGLALKNMEGKSAEFYIDADNYDEYSRKHEASVDKVLFLQTRPNDKDTATLMASGAEGWVRAWSIHHKGGLLGQFTASHKPNEAVVAMTTDSKNEFLITGDTLGYIKVWDITEYCIKPRLRRKASAAYDSMMRRGRFPYTKQSATMKALTKKLDEKILSGFRPPPSTTNAEKTLKWPPKLNSFRAHLASITSISYAEDKGLLISCSTDCSVRLWTICGRYIGTFGQEGGWPKLVEPIEPEDMTRRMPRDVQRVASALTLKVLNGGTRPRWRLAKNIMMIISRNQKADQIKFDSSFDPGQLDGQEEEECKKAARGISSILGKSYKPKTRHKIPPTLPDIKHNQSQVVVYSSLPFTNLAPIKEITMPATLQEMHLRQQQSSADAAENNTSGGKGTGKRYRIQEFLNKQRAVKALSRGKHSVHFASKK